MVSVSSAIVSMFAVICGSIPVSMGMPELPTILATTPYNTGDWSTTDTHGFQDSGLYSNQDSDSIFDPAMLDSYDSEDLHKQFGDYIRISDVLKETKPLQDDNHDFASTFDYAVNVPELLANKDSLAMHVNDVIVKRSGSHHVRNLRSTHSMKKRGYYIYRHYLTNLAKFFKTRNERKSRQPSPVIKPRHEPRLYRRIDSLDSIGGGGLIGR